MSEILKTKIEELETELKNTKVNKRTEMAVGLLKAKIARLKEELEKKESKGKRGVGYAVKKEGDATIGLLGKPSVGKSTILSKITNKESKIGAYEFTTLEVVPGLLYYNHTNLQILDLPGIIERACDNRGFGKKVLSVVRASDLVVFVIDVRTSLRDMAMLLNEVNNAGIRINKKRAFIEIQRNFKGGVKVPINLSKDKLPYQLIKKIINDHGLINCEVLIHEDNLDIDDLIDAIYKNIVYKKGVICLNKIDLVSKEKLKQITVHFKNRYQDFPIISVSADSGKNLEEFKEFIWRNLDFIWIYLKEYRKDPDFEKPLVLKLGSTIKDVCLSIHRDLINRFKFAKVKGNSVKFDWQRVGLEHRVSDRDIIEIHLK